MYYTPPLVFGTGEYDDSLPRKNTLTYIDGPLNYDEELSPTLHNVTILHWLQIIHPKMRDLVTQRFSKELRNATYASIWPEISLSIDSFLKDLSDESASASVCRYDSSSDYPPQKYAESNRPWRGRGSTPRFRGTLPHRSQGNRRCDYCRLTGRRAYETHNIEDCLFLKKERPTASRAVEVEEEYDDHYAEFLEVYDESPGEDNSRKVIINKITTEDSPVLPLFRGKKTFPVTLDTGGTTTIVDGGTAEELECNLFPTQQRAFQADGVTELTVLGTTHSLTHKEDKDIFHRCISM